MAAPPTDTTLALSRGVFLDRDTVDRDDLDLGSLHAAVPQLTLHGHSPAERTTERLRDVEVVITNKVRLDETNLQAASGLRLVCISATGTNNVDLAAARAAGIAVCNVPGYATAAVVEHVFAVVLALTRRLEEYTGAVRAGRWQQADSFALLDFPVRELAGKVFGIVGLGDLGHGVAKIAEAFGMQVLVAQRPGTEDTRPGRLPLDELLAKADVLTLHTPLTPQTRGLIGARELALMKPDALLINAARGGIVDEAALADALRAGRLGGAAVDVLTEEPPVRGNPLLDFQSPRLIVTPHVAWASREARQRVIDEVAANIEAFRQGVERNRVA
ncbi:MAG: 2-hydroxyacid dehydrogenase [Gammaproteobacteria bacterium]